MMQDKTFSKLIKFAVPYLVSCFLQTFYGLADLFITGQFNGADVITAVSVGSQVMHMVTVIIVGFVMGTTVLIGRSVGAGNRKEIGRIIGNSIVLFMGVAIIVTTVPLILLDNIIGILSVPQQAVNSTRGYLSVCFAGVIFITAYNVICGIYRGLNDTRTPMYFVAIAGVINIGLDYVLIGIFGMGATGAAMATVFSQGLSVVIALIYSVRKVPEFKPANIAIKPDRDICKKLVMIGFPVAMQDGFIQIAFLVITVIANMRGLEAAAAVGIVEKLIGFMFLVPSAMLSSVSAICASDMGAGKHEEARKTLFYGIRICVFVGFIFSVLCIAFGNRIVGLFAGNEEMVVIMGTQYLSSYVTDCMIAGIHFCFSGYFCAYGKSYLSFVHNAISIITVRIPGSYIASKMFADTLLPMGMAAPMGSVLSSLICVWAYFIFFIKSAK